MKSLLIVIMLVFIAAANDPVGSRGYHLGQKVDKEVILDLNLLVYANTGTLCVSEIRSYKDCHFFESTLRYLNEKYGTFVEASSNYEENKVLFKVLNNAAIILTNNNKHIEITYLSLTDE
jgi:hypothetical protein